MNVTKPVMTKAVLYFSATDDSRSQKKIVLAIIEARVKDRPLYTRSNSPAVILNIMVKRAGVVRSVRKEHRPGQNIARNNLLSPLVSYRESKGHVM